MAPPSKNKMKGSKMPKMTTQTLLDFDLGESSSDSDFRIEDHDESDDDFSENSNAVDSGQDDSDDDDDDSDDSDADEDSSSGTSEKKSTPQESEKNVKEMQKVLETAKAVVKHKVPTNPICCACLGERSDDANEIVECDGCGASVHEGCYGVSDSASVSSTISSCSTEPWFCEACKAGVTNPSCELCPNRDGIFKETDVGKWVHLVCALYVPGVAFGEVDHLSSVTLFEMSYNKWGSKTCSLCDDARFARTGVCIGCDAGMCKTYFHVTCAQAAGFLSEAHSEEVDHADPFYAHCKIHSDKTMIKHRKRNYYALKLRLDQRRQTKKENELEKPSAEQLRIQRKLNKHQTKYRLHKSMKTEPWVPTQKIPRLLTTSATACRRLIFKAELMGIDTAALEFQEAQMAALADVRKKWHIPPAFSVEFIGYYLDRISRLKDLKSNLQRHTEINKKLIDEQQTCRDEYDKKINANTDISAENTKLKDNITSLHKTLQALCPSKTLPTIENIGRPATVSTPPPVAPSRPMSVPTAAALKMGVGFPLVNLPGTKDDTGRILSTQRQKSDDLVHECGICKRCNDQHLLAKCDTCHFYYHLGCLNPPLTRHPKKSKLYGWQCSECDKSDDSDAVVSLPKGPRKSRTRFSKDGAIISSDYSQGKNDDSSAKSTDTTPVKGRSSFDKTTPKKDSMNGEDEPFADFNDNSERKEVKIAKAIRADSPRDSLDGNGTKTKMNNVGEDLSVQKEKKEILTEDIKKDKEKYNKEEKLKSEDSKKEEEVNDDVKKESSSGDEIKKDGVKKSELNNVETKTEEKSETDILAAYSKMKQGKKSKKEKKMGLAEEKSILTEEITGDSVKPVTQGKVQNEGASVTKDANGNEKPAAESLPPPLPATQPIGESDAQTSTAELPTDNSTQGDVTDHAHKQNRKRRKEKRKRHNSSDNEKSTNKEHKRKRKKKSHDIENPSDSLIPKIKIKFKTLPLPGEDAPEPHFIYVSADMVRPLDISRPTSVETVDESTTNADDLIQQTAATLSRRIASPNSRITSPASRLQSPVPSTSKAAASSAKLPPATTPKRVGRKPGKRDSTTSNSTGMGESKSSPDKCDVCQQPGNSTNLVKCDECMKNYHFTCLDPPLKKTPKKRGYSWHCADCDPTDVEST